MPIRSDREYRDLMLSVPDEVQEEKKVVRGYASTFEEPYTLYENGEFRVQEVIDKNAFENTDMSDVIMQYNHEGRVFARKSNNTLSIVPDERGLLIEADLGGTELGRQLYEEIRGGYTNKMSFGFTVDGESREREDRDGEPTIITRRITSVKKLYDVSAVSIPANDATEISVRNLTDGVIEKIQAERLEAEELELRRRKLLMRLQLEERHDER